MESIIACNNTWREHLEENRLLMLYMERLEIEIIEHSIFHKILMHKRHRALKLDFINEKTKKHYYLKRGFNGGWGCILNNDFRVTLVIWEPSPYLSQLLEGFPWERFGQMDERFR